MCFRGFICLLITSVGLKLENLVQWTWKETLWSYWAFFSVLVGYTFGTFLMLISKICQVCIGEALADEKNQQAQNSENQLDSSNNRSQRRSRQRRQNNNRGNQQSLTEEQKKQEQEKQLKLLQIPKFLERFSSTLFRKHDPKVNPVEYFAKEKEKEKLKQQLKQKKEQQKQQELQQQKIQKKINLSKKHARSSSQSLNTTPSANNIELIDKKKKSTKVVPYPFIESQKNIYQQMLKTEQQMTNNSLVDNKDIEEIKNFDVEREGLQQKQEKFQNMGQNNLQTIIEENNNVNNDQENIMNVGNIINNNIINYNNDNNNNNINVQNNKNSNNELEFKNINKKGNLNLDQNLQKHNNHKRFYSDQIPEQKIQDLIQFSEESNQNDDKKNQNLNQNKSQLQSVQKQQRSHQRSKFQSGDLSAYSQSKMHEKSQNQNCLICFDKYPDSVFMTCGHGGMCYDCSLEVWKNTGICYLCREEISHVLQVDSKQRAGQFIKVISATQMIQNNNDENEDIQEEENEQEDG